MAEMVGRAKQIILHRGKEASQTALGRALFASYFRIDIAMSVTMGNPVFLDETWWTNDPLNHITLTYETPIVVLADAALSRLTVIIAKLTHLKQSAEFGRRKMITRMHNSQTLSSTLQFDHQKLETRIRQQVRDVERELETWHRSLPSWFFSTQPEESDSENVAFLEDGPTEFVHPFIPIVISCAYAAKIQLWRIANPDEQTPPSIFAIVVNILNTFLQTTGAADLMIIPNVWIAGLFLRKKIQRDRLEKQIRKRIEGNDFFLWKFCLQGLSHGWASSEGKDNKPFKSLPDNAQEIVPGVSENLWKAEGVMNLLALEDEEDTEFQPLYRFTGDTKLFSVESDDSDSE